MKLTSVGRDTLNKLDQPLKELVYVSNHWGPLLRYDWICWLKFSGSDNCAPAFLTASAKNLAVYGLLEVSVMPMSLLPLPFQILAGKKDKTAAWKSGGRKSKIARSQPGAKIIFWPFPWRIIVERPRRSRKKSAPGTEKLGV